MANRHDVIIWDAEVYGLPTSFDEALNMVETLSEQSVSVISEKVLAFAKDIEKITKKMLKKRVTGKTTQSLLKTLSKKVLLLI